MEDNKKIFLRYNKFGDVKDKNLVSVNAPVKTYSARYKNCFLFVVIVTELFESGL